ncbi:MAG: PAS domain S-box protein [Bacteroidales bacterium]|nr:PAS domain S-box protein [Bacteroidales bacterium]
MINIKSILDKMNIGVCVISKNYDMEYINPYFESIFGPIEGRKCFEYFHQRDAECNWCKNEKVWKGEKPKWEWLNPQNQRYYEIFETLIENQNGTQSKLEVFHDITDYRRLLERLSDSLQFNTEVINCSETGIIVYDKEFRYILWNKFMEKLTGFSEKDVIGKNALDIFPHLKKEGIDILLQKALQGETVTSPDTRFYSPKTNNKGWVTGSYSPHKNSKGEIIGVIASVRNISIRKELELKTEHLNKVLLAIRNVNQLIVKEKNIDIQIKHTTDLLIETRGYSSVLIILTDNKNNFYKYAAAGLDNSTEILNEGLKKGLLTDCYKKINEHQGILHLSPDIRLCKDCIIHTVYPEDDLLCTVLKVDDKDYGYMIVSLPGQLGVSEDEQSLFAEVAGDIAFALYSIELETDKNTALSNLKKTEEKYRNIYENAIEGIYQSRPEGTYINVNPAFASILGYDSPVDLISSITNIGKQLYAIPEDREKLKEILKNKKVVKNFETQAKRKDGSIIWVSIDAVLIEDEHNKLSYFQGALIDINSRKKAEEDILMNDERMQTLLDILQYQYKSKQDFLNFALEEIINVTGSEIGYIFDYYDERKELVINTWSENVQKSYNIKDYPTVYKLEDTGILGEAVRQRKPIIINNFKAKHPLKKDPESHSVIHNYITTPVFNGTQIVAVVGLANKKSDYTQTDVLQLSLIMDAVWKVVERLKSEEALKNSEAKYKNIINNSIAGVYIQQENIIKFCNNRYASIFGYSSIEEALGINIKDTIFEEDLKLVDEHIQKRLTGTEEDSHYEFRGLKKDGTIFYCEVLGNKIMLDGNPAIQGMLIDVTKRKQAEADLIKAKAKAEEMIRLKNNFLSNMSHELRTPLNGIIGFAELIKSNIADNKIREWIDIVEFSSQRLMETLDLILNLSKLEAEKVINNPTLIIVSDVVNDVYKFYKNAADKKNLSLITKIKEPGIEVSIDERLLREVLMNLVNNAIKYTKIGSVTIDITNDDKNIIFNIIDTGIGIAYEMQEVIFEEFRQESEGLSRNFDGTGLGLSITKRFVELMKGNISVKSHPGKGSVFTVRLPITTCIAAPANTTEKKPTKEYISESKTKSSKTVLIVENDYSNLLLTQTFLEEYYEFDSAVNAGDAIEMAKKIKYDFILMDINLGAGINGIQAANIIKSFKGYDKVPIIAITAFVMPGDKEEFLASGCSHYLAKPFSRKQIISLLKELEND